jgi:hypothetical protein
MSYARQIEEVAVVMDEFISTGAATAAPRAAVASGGHDPEPEPATGSSASSSSREDLIARIAYHQNELDRLGEELRGRGEKKRLQELGARRKEDEDEAEDEDNGDAIVNYFGKFAWTERLKEQMKTVFGIRDFRLAQEGCVCVHSCRRHRSPSSRSEMTASVTRPWPVEILYVLCRQVSGLVPIPLTNYLQLIYARSLCF